MPVPQNVGCDEKIGFSIKSSDKSKHKAGRRGYVIEQLSGHVRDRDRFSMDRISLAEKNGEFLKVINAAKSKRRIPESDRSLRGWQTFVVSKLRGDDLTVKGSPDPDDADYEYHADVIMPPDVSSSRPEKERLIRKLINEKCWLAYVES